MLNHAIIMAAGRGTRMMPLTNHIPKPMVELNGSSLISKGIDFLSNQIKNIHITVGYKGNMVADHVISKGVKSIFNTSGKGNAWWVYNTLLKHLDDPILVLTCDNVVELDLQGLYNEYKELKEPACLIVPIQPVKGLEGDFIFHKNNVVQKLSRTEPSGIYCSGIQILNPKKINALSTPTESFYDLWKDLMAHKNLLCSNVHPSKWIAVDTIEQLKQFSI